MIDQPDGEFESRLRASVKGDVSFDEWTRGIYSTDASNYQIRPVAVVCPKDDADVEAAITLAARFNISVLPRGGGTSLAGQTVGSSMVLDFSKYMNRLLELNVEERWVRVQPGLVRDELNGMLAEHGLQLAPDPATGNRANIGGMVGNNSSGTRSIVYGKTIDHTLELKIILADGTRIHCRELTGDTYRKIQDGNDREAELYREVARLVEENRDEIRARFPKVMRRVGGYNLDELVDREIPDLTKLIVGSEGTLAVMLEAKMNLEPVPAYTALCVPHFKVLREAVQTVPLIVKQGPSAVEILDRTLLNQARMNAEAAPFCNFLEGDPAAVLMVEFSGASAEEVARKAGELEALLKEKSLGYAWPVRLDSAGKNDVWEVRKRGLGLLLGVKTERKPLPFIEDASVPVEVLPEYIDEVLEVCKRHNIEVAMYAHASVGLIHVRPLLDLRRKEDIEAYRSISDQTFELVRKYKGSWSGEHGDGLVRSPYMERFFGSTVYQAFKEIKKCFDPLGLMNPGKIVDAPPMTENLRFGEAYRTPDFETVYHYRSDRSFANAVHLCSGVGACRKIGTGTMCPSYMGTRDEAHTTRGRANALRLAMSGQMGPDGMTDRRLYEVLDLCLGCKACKSECPSNVDMARLKGEFLQKYRDRHGVPFRDKLIGKAPEAAARIAGWKAPLVNWIQDSGPFKAWIERSAGIDRRRSLPRFARQSLSAWFKQRATRTAERKVALFADTFLNYHEPEVGQAAVELLESCGFEVVLAEAGCCQRTRISQGLLKDARRDGERTLKRLLEFIETGLDVVVCEPSCASALLDDLPDLIDDEGLGERIKKQTHMIDVFLADRLAEGTVFESDYQRILLHGHCHQKALFRTAAMKKIYQAVEGLEVTEVDSGCCGMAGSFGYEKEHYDLSMKIGGQRLFPAIRETDEQTAIVASGFSCRHQIYDGTGRKAIHWVQSIKGKSKE